MQLKLKIKILDIYANYSIAILHVNTAQEIGAQNLDRIDLTKNDFHSSFVVDTSFSYVSENQIGIFKDTAKEFDLNEGDEVFVNLLSPPKATKYIMNKVKNKTLEKEEINEIIFAINKNALSEAELSAFVTGIFINALNIDEIKHLCSALIDVGDKMDFGKNKVILDKHSIGGINGRVSMLIVPIIASLGYKIPKTASRSITSAAGTADSMNVLSDVSFEIDKVVDIVDKVDGAVVWEGKIDLCPVDNRLIDIEHALGINPEGLMIASILSKKKSIGSTHLVIDIPIGRYVKIKNKEDGERLAKKFIVFCNYLGIKSKVLITDGDKPCGVNFGPALEAKNVLEILEGKYQDSVFEKSCYLSGALLELAGHCKDGEGYEIAKQSITSGKALEKFKEILKAQNGKIFNSQDVPKAKFVKKIYATEEGNMIRFNLTKIIQLTKILGCPKDISSGVVLLCKIGDQIKLNDPVFEIHSENQNKLSKAMEFIKSNNPVVIEKMVIEQLE